MADDPVPLDYLCPVCGESAVAGSHFCGKTPAKKPVFFRQPQDSRFPNRAVPLVAVLVATLVWWPLIGAWSLLLLGLGAGIFLAWVSRRR